MLFSSAAFLFFFAGYLTLHWLLPLRFRLPLIIAGSAIFYGYWNPYYLWLPFAMTLLAYYGALWMDSNGEPGAKRRRLAIVTVLLLAPLVIVKYTNFIYSEVVGPVAGFSGSVANWALPLGISFITFTLIAYVVDVYRGHFPVERNLKMLTGLVLFFPHLIAGPILRPAELLPQLRNQARLRRMRAVMAFGVTLFSVGLVKKVVFADTVSETVERVFSPDASGLSRLDYLVGIYGFALQIYCDFSGYTDMALGSALLLGVKLPRNFSRPYLATSLIEFWTRWHITLSKWLRDYLYIPLGGNRLGYLRQWMNLLVTMGLGGLWHGAN